ncbi:MAG: hypothetical protein JWP63_1174 [Candidatus Solibacter sp.]|nr:hypothetical protein [Candidatus Solibacter sp.]
MVHQDALILNYFQGAHYGGGAPGNFTGNQKLFGPWFTYIKTGEPAAMIADAKKKARVEQSRWPCRWMDEPLYPLERTRVTVPDAMIVLAKPGEEIYKQAGDFIYYSKADGAGKFAIPHVRPGSYALYAYATHGTATGQLEKDGVAVSGKALDLGHVQWTLPNHGALLWQIGRSDRMAGEFQYGQLRNIKWIGMVPADLTYTIGKSKDRDDWYFAQVDKMYAGKAHLTVAIAGISQNPRVTISVNGTDVKSLLYANDAATYRAALRSARYQLEEIEFPASLLHTGANTIRFAMTGVGGNGGLMYDTIKLDVE